jgi:hypothetical protein
MTAASKTARKTGLVFEGSKKALQAKKALPEDYKTRHFRKPAPKITKAQKAKAIKRANAKKPVRKIVDFNPMPAVEDPVMVDPKSAMQELHQGEIDRLFSSLEAGKKARGALARAFVRAKISKHVPRYIQLIPGSTLRPRECANCHRCVFPKAEVTAEGFKGFACSAECMLALRRKVHCHECFVSCSTSSECFLLPEKRITKLPRLGRALFACSPMCVGGVLQSERICACKVCDVRMIVPRYTTGIVTCSTACATIYVDRRNEYFHVLTYWLSQPEQADLRALFGTMGFAAFRELVEARDGPMDPFYGRGPSRYLPLPHIPRPVNDPIVAPTLFRQPRKARDMYNDKLVVFTDAFGKAPYAFGKACKTKTA